MNPNALLKYSADLLEKLTDEELKTFFAPNLIYTRPKENIEVKKKLEQFFGGKSNAKKVLGSSAPKGKTLLENMLSNPALKSMLGDKGMEDFQKKVAEETAKKVKPK